MRGRCPAHVPQPSVYAIGDLVPGPALAHKASDEGVIAVEDAAGEPCPPALHVDIPRATFCTPNVGSFGLTEESPGEGGGLRRGGGEGPLWSRGRGIAYGDRRAW